MYSLHEISQAIHDLSLQIFFRNNFCPNGSLTFKKDQIIFAARRHPNGGHFAGTIKGRWIIGERKAFGKGWTYDLIPKGQSPINRQAIMNRLDMKACPALPDILFAGYDITPYQSWGR